MGNLTSYRTTQGWLTIFNSKWIYPNPRWECSIRETTQVARISGTMRSRFKDITPDTPLNRTDREASVRNTRPIQHYSNVKATQFTSKDRDRKKGGKIKMPRVKWSTTPLGCMTRPSRAHDRYKVAYCYPPHEGLSVYTYSFQFLIIQIKKRH